MPTFPTTHRFALTALASALALPVGLCAQTTGKVEVDAATLQSLIEKVNDLEAQVKQLKANQASQTAAAAPVETPPPAPIYPLINFHGFADINYEYASQKDTFKNRFYLGEIDFYLNSQISQKASILSENVLSADENNNWNLEAERIEFDYRANPYLNVVAGRFHTQMGFYNTAYHHGTWFQNDTHRPWFLDFEDSGGIIPVHTVGLSLDGEIPSGSANLHYYAQVGNGRAYASPSSVSNPTQADTVDEGTKAVNLAVVAKPDGTPDWEFGAGLYHDTIAPEQPGIGNFAEYIANVSVVYMGEDWHWLNEAFVISHQGRTGSAHHTFAGYSEVSRKLGLLTPYYRFTYVNSPDSDPVYSLIQTTGLRYGSTFGLRYDFEQYACLKLQFDTNTQKNSATQAPSDDLTMQVGFTF